MSNANLGNSTSDFSALSSRELVYLVEKYSVSGPRYTSYPTAVEFSSALSIEEWQEAIKTAANQSSATLGGNLLSLYFHIPFCQSLCYYCACNKIVPKDRSLVGPYLAAMSREIRAYAKMFGSETTVKQIHWGGGTPNYLTPSEIRDIHDACVQAYPNIAGDAEVSIEVDPRTLSDAHLSALVGAGFNRISLGVQDFNPAVQEAVNRVQSFELTRNLCNAARDAGFGGVNIDLIYGLPKQTVRSFIDTIDKIIEIKPDRIALYGYAHVQWLQKVQKTLERSALPQPSERIAIFVESIKRLIDYGYCYIGMDHFALPNDSLYIALRDGFLMRNFMGYTAHKGAHVIGHGMSSISSLAGAYWQNVKEINRYELEISRDRFPVERGLIKSPEDCMRGEIIQDIFCQGQVDISSFENRWKMDFWSTFSEPLIHLKGMEQDGLLSIDSQTMRLSSIGRLFMRNVAMTFDAYLNQHRTRQTPVFSQTV